MPFGDGVLPKLLLFGLIAGSLFSIPSVQLAQTQGQISALNVPVIQFGYVGMSHHVDVLSILFYVFPQVLCVYVLGTTLRMTVKQYAPYVVTRNGRRGFWVLLLFSVLFVRVAFYDLVLFTASTAISCFFHPFAVGQIHWWPIVSTFLLSLLSTYFVVLSINVLGIDIPTTFGAIWMIGMQFLCLLTTSMQIGRWLNWTPFSQEVYFWHQDAARFSHLFSGLLPETSVGPTVAVSLLYLAICSAIAAAWGLYRIKTMDFM
jgi:hypothetical protein